MHRTGILLTATCLSSMINGTALAAEQGWEHDESCATVSGDTLAWHHHELSQDDQETATWENERALYMHDMQMSSLDRDEEQRDVSKANRAVIGNLIDAELYIAYAETDQVLLGDYHSAGNDLDQALVYLKAALGAASGSEKSHVTRLKEKVTSFRNDINSCRSQAGWHEMHDYQGLRTEFSHIIHRLT
jgi:hypothetical protein